MRFIHLYVHRVNIELITEQRSITYQQIGGFESRAVHMVDVFFFKNPRKSIYKAVLIYVKWSEVHCE